MTLSGGMEGEPEGNLLSARILHMEQAFELLGNFFFGLCLKSFNDFIVKVFEFLFFRRKSQAEKTFLDDSKAKGCKISILLRRFCSFLTNKED